MKIGLIKKNGRVFVELPAEFADYEELEVFKLRDGFYIIATPLENLAAKPGAKEGERKTEKTERSSQTEISEKEKEVVEKLSRIRFEQRTPDYVAKVLNKEELELLRQLERKGFINIYKGQKYKQGVYNISDQIYSFIYHGNKSAEKKDAVQNKGTPYEQLVKEGYLVASEKEALALLEKIRDQVKKGEIKGMKGFDNNYYIMSSRYYSDLSRKILKVLDRDMQPSEIAKILRVDEGAVRAALLFLSEAGEVIEKRKNIYAAV